MSLLNNQTDSHGLQASTEAQRYYLHTLEQKNDFFETTSKTIFAPRK